PEGDTFYLVATDLNVDAEDHGWRGWDWAQSDASRHIEVWESRDLRTWSAQRHVLVAPEEAGMTFAPEAIWDAAIGAYVVYWTSSVYARGTHYTPDEEDPKRRSPLTRNQILYTTTRDFVSFSPARVMSGRPGHGALDAVIIQDEDDGYYHRFVCDRTSTGNATQYVPCGGEDIYQERAASVLAGEDEWELVAGCITHGAMNTTYAEAPLVARANKGDPRGEGYYMYVDQKWIGSPAGDALEEQLHPYWTADLASGSWAAIDWGRKPEYELAQGVIRHGSVVGLTTAEHAGLRGAELTGISVREEPAKKRYLIGEDLELAGLCVEATYSDGVVDELLRGYGGYSVAGFESGGPGVRTVSVSYSVVGVTKSASFEVQIRDELAVY
ncbi:glycoside hydrolase family 43 protein, partial [Candidatus Bathyarchaeota archaeon]|nr:glycoside hydrolase family 43 protein [Candidatus Bathyarchaeota archaeon]